ncbi:MAG: 1-acyl-sn-glycerol-3-phosphate acyltransferase [Acidimicrobiia bacterium]|nr:1-acyl-sn-glycerol-3-phosphate acyltransferase [Acidimicrobiia bacterium]
MTTRSGPVADLLARRPTKLLGRSVAGRRAKRGITGIARSTRFPVRAASAPKDIEVRRPPKRTGTNFPTDWARTVPARVARVTIIETLMRPAIAALARPERTNADRLGDVDGPIIFVANHHSHVDTPLLLTSIPLPWRHEITVGAASDYFFGTMVTGALSALAIGAIPIERSKIGRGSADLAAGLITDGWSLLIYPEGGRSKDGWGQPFRGGAAYLSLRCDVPIVPVYVSGTGHILRKGSARPHPSNTVVNFGRPIWPDPGEKSRRYNERIEVAVAELGDEAGSNWWEAKRRRYSGETPGLGGPSVGSWRRAWALGDRSARRARTRRWPEI